MGLNPGYLLKYFLLYGRTRTYLWYAYLWHLKKNMVLILSVLDHAINLHFFKPTYTSKWYVIFTFQFHLVDFCGVMKMNCHVSNWITHQSAQEMMIMKIHGVTMTGVNFRKLQFNSLNRTRSEIIPNPIFKQFLVCGIVDLCYEGSEWYLNYQEGSSDSCF